MRLLVINYQQKHKRLRMSSHFLRKQLVTGFFMFVSSIYQKKIGREKERNKILLLYKGKHCCIYGLQSTSSRRQPFLLGLLNSRQIHRLHFQFLTFLLLFKHPDTMHLASYKQQTSPSSLCVLYATSKDTISTRN